MVMLWIYGNCVVRMFIVNIVWCVSVVVMKFFVRCVVVDYRVYIVGCYVEI